MTLVIEELRGGIWLCARFSTKDANSQPLAKFASREAAEIYKQAIALSLCVAREVGRSGIG